MAQPAKSAARGFRNTRYFRTRIFHWKTQLLGPETAGLCYPRETSKNQKKGTASTRCPLTCSSEAIYLLLKGIHKLLDARFALSSLVLMDDALGSCLVELAVCNASNLLSFLSVTVLDSDTDLLYIGLELGSDCLIADACLLGSLDTLLLRLDVCHDEVPFSAKL
jgi:hypothetical protein